MPPGNRDRSPIEIDGESLTIDDVVHVSKGRQRVALAASALARIDTSRQFVEQLIRTGRPVYGITTGVGQLADQPISPKDVEKLQLNLIRSHAVRSASASRWTKTSHGL